MKSKKITYLLICCVAAVWGIVFHRIFTGMASEEIPFTPETTTHESYFNMVDHANDNIALNLAYNDPYSPGIDQMEVTSNNHVEQFNTLRTVQQRVSQNVNWAGVIYSGQIFNPIAKRHVAIISVNGLEVMLSQGESVNGLKFIKRVGDSIKVEYQNATKFLSINR